MNAFGLLLAFRVIFLPVCCVIACMGRDYYAYFDHVILAIVDQWNYFVGVFDTIHCDTHLIILYGIVHARL